MNACFGQVEVFPDKRRHRRNIIIGFFGNIIGYFGNDRRVHAIEGALKRSIFKNHRFQRDIAGSFADAEQRAVNGGSAVKPGGRSICHTLIEIVVAMPFYHIA